jgi:hypothetical protein
LQFSAVCYDNRVMPQLDPEIATSAIANENASPNLPTPQPFNQTQAATPVLQKTQFPTSDDILRLSDYEYFHHLLMGEHFEAFAIRINNQLYSQNYGKLRYVATNFAGLLSKVCADMLFSEPISIKMPDDGDQEWIDQFMIDNHVDQQLYESAVDASALGDTCFKLRVDKRHPNDKEMTVILEEFSPAIYFPVLDPFNVKGQPKQIDLKWTFKDANGTVYLRVESHEPGKITDRVYRMNGREVGEQVNLDILGIEGMAGMEMVTETGVDHYLVFHIPNWKTGNRHFGISDYYDLDKLFYAIDNRLTKIDNILDKHSDPILMVPDGVLDDEGNVKREALNMIEVPEGQTGQSKPEYIVWNANLEAAFMQIDKLLSFFMMTAEITPDILGMGEGMNDSGRALKFKLMRTIAKGERKKLYYDAKIKTIMYVAQELALAAKVGVGPDFQKLTGKPQFPEIDWQDGLPIDDYEEVDNEIKKIDAGIQSKIQAIQNLDDIDEEAAEEKMKEIDEEQKLDLPVTNLAPTQVTATEQVGGNGQPVTNPTNNGEPPAKPK